MITRYRQLHRHAPDEGLIGDCWRTCIACILGLKPQQVPHFVEQAFEQREEEPEAHVRFANEWLAKRNLTLLPICLYTKDLLSVSRLPPVPYILGGKGSDGAGINHCVVGIGDFETLWDPSPWSTGPLRPLELSNGEKYYWLEFLLPINLAANPENS